MMKFLRWIRGNIRWLFDGWRVWGSLAVVALILAVSFLFPGRPDDHARYSGVLLQLLGIGTVVYGLRDRRRLFNRPTLYNHIRSWLGRRPRLNPKQQIITASCSGSYNIFGNAKASVWRAISSDASIESRIEALQANLETLRAEHAETFQELQNEARNRENAIDSERSERASADENIRSRLDTLGAGGLHIESAGLFWLITGVLLGTIPAEIATLLSFK